jgi:hypothetical protein
MLHHELISHNIILYQTSTLTLGYRIRVWVETGLE